MERYKLKELFDNYNQYKVSILTAIIDKQLIGLTMGLDNAKYGETLNFITASIYGYFYDDLVVYKGETQGDVQDYFIERLSYDIAIKLPYWYKKYDQIKKLLTTDDLSLMQTSKMTSSSNDTTNSAGGTLQKTATTPSGISVEGSSDSFTLEIEQDGTGTDASVETNGFADKYTNAQQKFANAMRSEGFRSGEVMREGSIDDLLKVLEKLPSSFADEINRDLQKHFIFDYDGEMKGYY